jgi:shikimate kinase
MSEALILVGLSGSGKSTLAREIGHKLGLPVLDTDRMIEERERRLIAEIFAQDGEERFRAIEAEMVRGACSRQAVIATGGGAVLRSENREAMRRQNLVIWIDPPVPLLARRLAQHEHAEERPLLRGDVEARLERLLAARRTLYEEVAHLRASQLANPASHSHQLALRIADSYQQWKARIHVDVPNSGRQP